MTKPRVLPLGDAAWSVELGDTLDLATNARVRALDRALAERPFDGFVEAVPTLRSLLVVYDKQRVRPAAGADLLADRLSSAAAPLVPGRLHEVNTLYGGDAGPDLEALARERGLSGRDLVRLHASGEYTAFMIGFKPGFAYLGLLPDPLDGPRLPTPRVRVPAGSVGVAGRQTGIYPVSSPGGWRLIGRTTLRLFDPQTEQWSIYWSDTKSFRLFPPTIGRFHDGRGVFFGDDVEGGKPVRVRFDWAAGTSPVWEQSFSSDGEKSWEKNWIMRFERA